MSEWTTADKLRQGNLFETATGFFVCIHGNTEEHDPTAVQVGGRGFGKVPVDTQVHVIDIPFLLAAAGDRLQEHEGYQRGLREGAEKMRKAVVDTLLAWGHHWPPQQVIESIEHLPVGTVLNPFIPSTEINNSPSSQEVAQEK